jgi:3-hydroxymyristoyl/3-hydroxydecanoyl-(acyl carrier protein) dehydratase
MTGPSWMPAISEIALDADSRSLKCRFLVPADLPFFRGHFPEVPIVPGVVQVGWAVELARAHGLVTGPCVGIITAKFRRLLRPGMRLEARLERSAPAGQLHFEYECEGAVVSNGRLQFEGGHD